MSVIIILDPDKAHQTTLRHLLSASPTDLQIRLIGTPEEAIDLAEKQEITALISEMDMPIMSGLELFDMFRMISPATVLIAMMEPKDIPHTLSIVNEGNIFKMILKPCKIANDILAPIQQAVQLYEMRRSKVEQEQRRSHEINGLDEQYDELEKIRSFHESVFENAACLISGMVEGNMSLKGDEDETVDLAFPMVDELWKGYMKYYVLLDTNNYLVNVNTLGNLFRNPEKNRNFQILRQQNGDLQEACAHKVFYAIYLMGCLGKNLLQTYETQVHLRENHEFYQVDYQCGTTDLLSKQTYRIQNKEMRMRMIEYTYRTMKSLFDGIQLVEKNPFSVKIMIRKKQRE